MYETAIVAGWVRLDLYGEVLEGGRVAAFLTAEQALDLSRKLGQAWRQLPSTDTEDLV